jgi:hypothetical protein
LDDWVYGELGVAAYTIELGTAFFESCTTFQNTIYPANRPALRYACKACRQPYRDPAGPEVLQPIATPATNGFGATFNLSALANSGRSAGYSPLPPAANLTAARYSVDQPSWSPGVTTYAMSALDGSFNSPGEFLSAVVPTTGWSAGRHTIFIEARTGTGDWGVPTAVFVFIEPLTLTASLHSGGFLLQSPSVSGKSYTLLQASNLASPFTVLASNLPAQAPRNTYLDSFHPVGTKFYRLQLEP